MKIQKEYNNIVHYYRSNDHHIQCKHNIIKQNSGILSNTPSISWNKSDAVSVSELSTDVS